MGWKMYYIESIEEWNWIKAVSTRRKNADSKPVIVYYLNINRFRYGNGFHWANFVPNEVWFPTLSGWTSDYLGAEDCAELYDRYLSFNDITCSVKGSTTYASPSVTHSFICKPEKCSLEISLNHCSSQSKTDEGSIELGGWKFKNCQAKAKVAYVCKEEP